MEKFKLSTIFNHKKFRQRFSVVVALLLMTAPTVMGLMYYFPPERRHEVVPILFLIFFLLLAYTIVIIKQSEVILTIDKDKIFLEYKDKRKILKKEEYPKDCIVQIGKLGVHLFTWYYIFVVRIKFTDHKYKDFAINPIDVFLEKAKSLEYNIVDKIDIEKEDVKINDLSGRFIYVSWGIVAFISIIYTFFIILLTSII